YHPLVLTEMHTSKAGTEEPQEPANPQDRIPGPPAGANRQGALRQFAAELTGNELVLLGGRGDAQPKDQPKSDKKGPGQPPPGGPSKMGLPADKMKAAEAEKDAPPQVAPSGKSCSYIRTLTPGDSRKREIDGNLPDIPAEYVSDETKKTLEEKGIPSVTRGLSSELGYLYDMIC